MKCPNCGFEMQEGHLICEQCGYEVKIVPEFTPEMEPQIDNNVLDDILGDKKESDKDPGTETSDLPDIGSIVDIKAVQHRALVLIIIICAGVLILAGAIWFALYSNSLDHQLNNAKKQVSEGKYENAINTLENLYVSHPGESEIFFLEAECYEKMDKPDLAEDTLRRMISSQGFSDEDEAEAYDRLISLYAEAEDYGAINDLLGDCSLDDVLLAYQNYMAMPPVFSEEAGNYTDSLLLKLSANTSGVIYYTLDGSVPNELSSKYDSPIALDHGEYVVTAVFVNKYGIQSEMVSKTYTIASDIPDAPVVNADSDDYTTPVLITCQVPEGTTIYYTTDKSTPTVDSVMYTDPIPMPIGYSNFNFIAINDQGLSSDVTVRSYYLNFPDGLTTGQAIDALKTRLIERGLLKDAEGHSDRAPGTYTYQAISAIPITGQGDYYTIREFYHDGSGGVTPTDTTYIVEIHQGSTAILGGNAENGFLAIAF